ncbi:hypothetical protein J0674_16070 [Vibrio parahaemolyticus]|nr:hypothetical protein [Vibrio parahaemolyticus]EKO3570179.1 hypothetical protein [Vibrio metschnikovii]HBC3534543.1 hypothetical protein [Vibrio vulnificus]EKO3577766.1 hypothetical protein [Vibrio metschnikovii]EKO3602767.1 hypothetical protein [Vibrio metschnikovii]
MQRSLLLDYYSVFCHYLFLAK